MNHRHRKFGSSDGNRKMLRRLKNVKTKNNWDTLSSCGGSIAIRERHGPAIRAQPTAIERKKLMSPKAAEECYFQSHTS